MVIRSPFFEAKLQLGVAVFVRACLCVSVAKKGFEKNEGLSLKPSPLLPHNQPGP